MLTSKAYEIHVYTCCLILMEGMALIFSKRNALGTSEMNVLSVGKVNTLSLVYIPSHTPCISNLILLWEEIHLKLLTWTLVLIWLMP